MLRSESCEPLLESGAVLIPSDQHRGECRCRRTTSKRSVTGFLMRCARQCGKNTLAPVATSEMVGLGALAGMTEARIQRLYVAD